MIYKQLFAAAAALTTLTAASAASATIYTYDIQNGAGLMESNPQDGALITAPGQPTKNDSEVLTINTANNTASLTGNGVDILFNSVGNSFKNFNGNISSILADPISITSQSYITYGGKKYYITQNGLNAVLKYDKSTNSLYLNSTNVWETQACIKHYNSGCIKLLDDKLSGLIDVSGTPSGDGTSGNGTSVAEPANFALFGLGVLAVAAGRRWNMPRRAA